MQVNGLQFAGRHSADATLPWLRSSGFETATQLRLWIDGFEGTLETYSGRFWTRYYFVQVCAQSGLLLPPPRCTPHCTGMKSHIDPILPVWSARPALLVV